MSLRSLVKRTIERTLVIGGRRPSSMRGRTLILAYHNVVPDGEAGRGESVLHLPFSRFQRQLDLLEKHTRVVPLSQALSQPASGDRPWIAITFDDAYRGAVELALPELARRNLPATVFVAPRLLDTRATWWDALAEQPAGMSEAMRDKVLTEFKGKAALVEQQGLAPVTLPDSYACADEATVRALSRFPLVTLGAHTWTHPNLAAINGVDLNDELTRPLQWLSDSGVATISALAYPYGLTNDTATAATVRAGYADALLVTGGWHVQGEPARHATPRFNVPAGLSDDGFRLRLAGYFNE